MVKDIFRIELNDLNLEAGKIYVPAGIKRKASRTLKLEPHQVIPLYDYIHHHRKDDNEKLFSSRCEHQGRLHDQFKSLSKRVKEQSKEHGILSDPPKQTSAMDQRTWLKKSPIHDRF